MKKTNQEIIPSLGVRSKLLVLILFFLGVFMANSNAQSYVATDEALKLLIAEQKEHRAVSSDVIAARDVEAALAQEPMAVTKELFIVTMLQKLGETKNVATSIVATEQDLLERGIGAPFVTAVKQEIQNLLEK